MRVLFLINNCNIGGAQYVAHKQVVIAQQAGLDVTVLTGTTGFFYDKMVASGARVIHCGFLNEGYNQKNLSILEKYVMDTDVVFNCVWLHMNYYIAKLKFRHRFSFMNVIHSDVDYAVNIVMRYASVIDRQYVIHERIERALLRVGFPKEKIWVIHNAVDMDGLPERTPERVAALRKEFGIKSGELVLGVVTRINTDKNILDTIRLVHRIWHGRKRKVVLMIIGGPSEFRTSQVYYRKLLEYIKIKKMGRRVRMLGAMSTQDVYRIQPVFDVAVNVSPSEGLPITLLEQMAAGVYCVYPGVGDIPQVLGADGSRGKVVPIRQRMKEMDIHRYFNYDDEELNAFVDHICGLDDNKIWQAGRAARRWILENRNMELHATEFLSFIGYADNKINRELTYGRMKVGVLPDDEGALPEVSVLMTVKDTPADWLKEALWSVLLQTYRNFEMILVDDSGDDCYGRFVERLCEQHGIRYVRTDGPVGVGPASNEGLNYCRGKWVARVDSDDTVMSIWLERQLYFARRHKNARVIGCQLRAFGNADWVSKHKLKRTREDVLKARRNRSWIINHGGVLIDREVLVALGGYRTEKLRRGQDFDLWIDLLKEGYDLYTNQAVLYMYRIWKEFKEESWWKEYAEGRVGELLK